MEQESQPNLPIWSHGHSVVLGASLILLTTGLANLAMNETPLFPQPNKQQTLRDGVGSGGAGKGSAPPGPIIPWPFNWQWRFQDEPNSYPYPHPHIYKGEDPLTPNQRRVLKIWHARAYYS